ncbi:MAG: hypothetical protein R3E89_01535 [Thiolinea sp.]
MNGAHGRASHLLILSIVSIMLGAALLTWLLTQSSFFNQEARGRIPPLPLQTGTDPVSEPVRGNIRIPQATLPTQTQAETVATNSMATLATPPQNLKPLNHSMFPNWQAQQVKPAQTPTPPCPN